MIAPIFSSASERIAWLRSRRLKYLGCIEGGLNSTQAARLVGASKRAAKAWRNGRRRSGGRNGAPSLPFYNRGMKQPNQCSPKFLTLKERAEICHLLKLGHSRREIAKKLGLRIYILGLLELRWPPMQISKHLSETYPDDASMRLSPESIYQAIYMQGKGRLKEKLKKLMRQGRAGRIPRKSKAESAKARFREPMASISQRPAEANDRAVPGHWEGDLIMGKKKSEQTSWRPVAAGKGLLSPATELDIRIDAAAEQHMTLDLEPNNGICILRAKLNPECLHDRLTKRACATNRGGGGKNVTRARTGVGKFRRRAGIRCNRADTQVCPYVC